jgi:hypothetical protein
MGYYDNYLRGQSQLRDRGVQATAARMSQETVTAQDMLARFARWQDESPCPWWPIPPTEMGGSCNGYWGRRIAHSTAPNVLRISRKATAIAVP